MSTIKKAKKRTPKSAPDESLETIRKVQRRLAAPSPSHLPSPDVGGNMTPAPPWCINDPSPSWPRKPFSKKSRSYGFANTYCYFGGNLGEFSIPVPLGPDEKDKRLRYAPLWTDVCAFLRWDIGFNWQVPTWSDWLTVLTKDCGMNPNHCELLDIPQIVSILDNTPEPDELKFAADVIDDLADQLRTLEQLTSGEIVLSKSQIKTREHSIRIIVLGVAALLLKVHGLPRNLQVLGQYPGDSWSHFFSNLDDRLGGESLDHSFAPLAKVLKKLANQVRAYCIKDGVHGSSIFWRGIECSSATELELAIWRMFETDTQLSVRALMCPGAAVWPEHYQKAKRNKISAALSKFNKKLHDPIPPISVTFGLEGNHVNKAEPPAELE